MMDGLRMTVRSGTIMNPIITLLLEEDVIFLPKPGVGQVAWIRFCLAGEECILGYVDCYVFWWGYNKWWPWKKDKKQGLTDMRVKKRPKAD